MSFITYTIGRGKSADIVIDHESVSRLHAELTVTSSGKYYLVDRNSSLGTCIIRENQAHRIECDYLHPGDQVVLGECKLKLDSLLAMMPDHMPSEPHFKQMTINPKRHRSTGEIIL